MNSVILAIHSTEYRIFATLVTLSGHVCSFFYSLCVICYIFLKRVGGIDYIYKHRINRNLNSSKEIKFFGMPKDEITFLTELAYCSSKKQINVQIIFCFVFRLVRCNIKMQ